MSTNNCVLKLNHLLFDKILFQRNGFKTDNKLEFSFGFNFKTDNPEEIIVHIQVIGTKKSEYRFEVAASGYFSYVGTKEKVDLMARQNAAAIIFPYIRSQITLLTAQPEMEAVVLPPLNIASIIKEAEKPEGNGQSV